MDVQPVANQGNVPQGLDAEMAIPLENPVNEVANIVLTVVIDNAIDAGGAVSRETSRRYVEAAVGPDLARVATPAVNSCVDASTNTSKSWSHWIINRLFPRRND